MKLQLPNSLQPSTFLQSYWQKKPLLIRAGLAGYRCPLDPRDLAGLACEDTIESRIVLEHGITDPWEVRHGPFDHQDFASLPKSHWTLLVQDVDKHVPEVAELLDTFDFLPDWRLDDIMISYAADQGSVGPHVDDYDVFLVQAGGRRRWQIHTRPVSEDDYIPDLSLRVLPKFEPEQEWLLEPGDVLYLPPNVAHWGVAEGDDCVTCSVGYRTPTFSEMAMAWCDELINTRVPEGRYRDGELNLQPHKAEIPAAALERIGQLLDSFLHQDPDQRARWFGRFISEPKTHLEVASGSGNLADEQLLDKLKSRRALRWNGWSRPLFLRGKGDLDYLYVNGKEYSLTKSHGGFFESLTRSRSITHDALMSWIDAPACVNLLARLYNEGHFHPDDE